MCYIADAAHLNGAFLSTLGPSFHNLGAHFQLSFTFQAVPFEEAQLFSVLKPCQFNLFKRSSSSPPPFRVGDSRFELSFGMLPALEALSLAGGGLPIKPWCAYDGKDPVRRLPSLSLPVRFPVESARLPPGTRYAPGPSDKERTFPSLQDLLRVSREALDQGDI